MVPDGKRKPRSARQQDSSSHDAERATPEKVDLRVAHFADRRRCGANVRSSAAIEICALLGFLLCAVQHTKRIENLRPSARTADLLQKALRAEILVQATTELARTVGLVERAACVRRAFASLIRATVSNAIAGVI